MVQKLILGAAVAVLAASAAHSQYIGNNPGNLPWGPGPVGMPKTVKMIVVSGDPTQPGPYAIQLRFPAGYRIGPHRHPYDESYRIITGGMTFSMGTDKHAATKSLTKGSTGVVPANTYYAASTAIGATVEFKGTGPMQIEYAKAKDDPRN